jgi:CheY-like chemotaxis protein
MMRKLVVAQGHLFELAEDGIEAVEKVKTKMNSNAGVEGGKTQYDAILMDFVMPNMDGPTGIYIYIYLFITVLS